MKKVTLIIKGNEVVGMDSIITAMIPDDATEAELMAAAELIKGDLEWDVGDLGGIQPTEVWGVDSEPAEEGDSVEFTFIRDASGKLINSR